MLINCKKISDNMRKEVTRQIEELNLKPTLALVRVLGDEASAVYVRNKVKACEEVGINSIVIEMEESTDEETLIAKIDELNRDSNVNGILVQLPLPQHISEKVVNKIHPLKDVDCLSETNIGKLFSKSKTNIEPCTPSGILEILKQSIGNIEGLNVLIINRSMLVGKPLAEMLQKENTTVTLAHSKTSKRSLGSYMLLADIIITGVGKVDFIGSEMIDDYMSMRKLIGISKQTFIDVSMNRDEYGKLCGDISKDLYDREDLYITPVPRGVGLTTVSALLRNVVKLTKIQKRN